MTIIVEDGTGVVNANSYVTVADTRAYASMRGKVLSVTDSDVEVLLIQAMDYLEAKRGEFQGYKTNPLQSLQWPRTCVTIDNVDFPNTSIPVELKKAEMQLAIEVSNGVDLMPTVSGPFIKSETVGGTAGEVQTVYSETVNTSLNPMLSSVDVLLAPLFGSYEILPLRTLRV